jgi:predicted N-acetyltransferase YhbS
MTQIRHGDISESAAIADIIIEAFSVYRGWLNPQPSALLETAATIAEKLRVERCLLAEIGGVLVGCVMYKPEDVGVYLGRLAVLPSYRRRGIALALVGAVEAEARRLRAESISLEVRVALLGNQRLFTDLGFVEVARHAHPGFSEPTSIEMRKRL